MKAVRGHAQANQQSAAWQAYHGSRQSFIFPEHSRLTPIRAGRLLGAETAGDGNNTVTFTAEAGSGAAFGLYSKSKITTVDGDDIITVNASSESGNAYGIFGLAIDVGKGSNTVIVNARSDYGHAYALL